MVEGTLLETDLNCLQEVLLYPTYNEMAGYLKPSSKIYNVLYSIANLVTQRLDSIFETESIHLFCI